ncbi:MAG TPA: flagellar hook-associated protein FlgK, partial [Rhodobacteraceae bacterium]|nr:flagellar hook-associated protein FlgK [Paracoccaceae bacterium]
MGLSSVLSTAISGLNINQSGLGIVSRNIANADTPGYTRKVLVQENQLTGGVGAGVRQADVVRDVNRFIIDQLREARTQAAGSSVTSEFLTRLDQLYGKPGSDAALDTIVNGLGNDLEQLAADPQSDINRQTVLAGADTLARKLNSLSHGIQAMRLDAERGISTVVTDINTTLESLAQVNQTLRGRGASPEGASGLLDRRDQLLGSLADLIDIRVITDEDGAVRVFTGTGDLLVDHEAASLSFDERQNVNAQTLYSDDDTLRGVGTVTLHSRGGNTTNLLLGNATRGGQLGAYVELRDDTLVQAQGQLDELAHALALSFSDKENTGTAVSVGGSDGVDLDVDGLLAGNAITVSYVENGTARTVSFVKVDDAATLPLSNDVTADPDDRVVGIDFSGGFAAAVADMNAALGAGVSITSPAAGRLRILDDGAAGTTDITSASARITSTAISDDGPQVALFRDTGGRAYSAGLDGGAQKLGFAERITLNSALAADPSGLVIYSTSPLTDAGDQTRPIELAARLKERSFTFSAQ